MGSQSQSIWSMFTYARDHLPNVTYGIEERSRRIVDAKAIEWTFMNDNANKTQCIVYANYIPFGPAPLRFMVTVIF